MTPIRRQPRYPPWRSELDGRRGLGCRPVKAFADVRQSLEDDRRRGVAFDDAWETAMRLIPGGRATQDLRQALADTAPAWRGAYELRPASQQEAAAARAAPALQDVEPGRRPRARLVA